MKITDAFPSNYLKASDLDGRTARVVMDRAAFEKIGNDDKLVLYFDGKTKGMVLNKTNAFTISQAYGDETRDWQGGEIELFAAMVDFQGKSVEALRVRIPPRRPAGRVSSGVNGGEPARREPAMADDRDDGRFPPAGARGGGMDDDIPFAPEWR